MTIDRNAGTNYTAHTMRLLVPSLLVPSLRLEVAKAELSKVHKEPPDSFNKLHDVCLLSIADRLTYTMIRSGKRWGAVFGK